MRKFLSRCSFPLAVIALMALQLLCPHRRVDAREAFGLLPDGATPTDTIIYPPDGYKRGWTPEEYALKSEIADSLKGSGDFGFAEGEEEWNGRPAALDTLLAPETLALTDTFRYRYWAALRDSMSHVWVRDSLIAAGDSLVWPVLDSLYAVDSVFAAEAAFKVWYASLDKIEKRKYDAEVKSKLKLAQMDSIKAVKDSIRAYKDSVLEATPRVLESYVFRDSTQFQRIFSWTHDRDFHDVRLRDEDTSYNYRFYDSPFRRMDAGATWLGLSGAPVVNYDVTKRDKEDGVPFYDALASWTYTPDNLPFYNTKTPYTELAYWGSLFSGSSHGSDNLHLLTSQNITPAFNFTLFYDRYGGEGTISNETTANKTSVINLNYTGRRYLMHTGYIHNKVTRSESGGILDNTWIRDTTVDAREIAVALQNASSSTVKSTVFLDQQYRIPFTFIERWKSRRDAPAGGTAIPDEAALAELAQGEGQGPAEEPAYVPDSLGGTDDSDITTAFIGHSSEYSVYRRVYNDQISNAEGQALYNNAFWLNPTTSADSMRVSRLDNKLYLRLQPWSADAIVSKLDVGAGYKLMHYYSFEPSYLRSGGDKTWNDEPILGNWEYSNFDVTEDGELIDFSWDDYNTDYYDYEPPRQEIDYNMALLIARGELKKLQGIGLLSTEIAFDGELEYAAYADEYTTEERYFAPSFFARDYSGKYLINFRIDAVTGEVRSCTIEADHDEDDEPIAGRDLEINGEIWQYYNNFDDIFPENLTVGRLCDLLAEYWGYSGWTLADSYDEFYDMHMAAPAEDLLVSELPEDNYYATVFFDGDQEGAPMFFQIGHFPGRVVFLFGDGHMVG